MKTNKKISSYTWWIFAIIGFIIGLINSDSNYNDSHPIAMAFIGLVNGALLGWIFGYIIDKIKKHTKNGNLREKPRNEPVIESDFTDSEINNYETLSFNEIQKKENNLDDELENYEDYNFESNDDKITVFDDEIINKKNNNLIISKMGSMLIEVVAKNNLENPHKGTPLEGLDILRNINIGFNVLKEDIIKEKENLELSDKDLEYIFSKIFRNTYSKFLE